jgi:hypothetical protein
MHCVQLIWEALFITSVWSPDFHPDIGWSISFSSRKWLIILKISSGVAASLVCFQNKRIILYIMFQHVPNVRESLVTSVASSSCNAYSETLSRSVILLQRLCEISDVLFRTVISASEIFQNLWRMFHQAPGYTNFLHPNEFIFTFGNSVGNF